MSQTWLQSVNNNKKKSYKVKFCGKLSESIDESIGVNQGCVTSPFLVREYLSDLKTYIDEYTGICLTDEILLHELFADDLYLVSENTAYSQKQFDGLLKFCAPNQMLVNVIKTKFMVYGHIDNVNIHLVFKGVWIFTLLYFVLLL